MKNFSPKLSVKLIRDPKNSIIYLFHNAFNSYVTVSRRTKFKIDLVLRNVCGAVKGASFK